MPPPGYPQPYPGPFYPKLPRNPLQNAAIAAGVMILIAGLFCLVFSSLILYWDGFNVGFDPDSGDDIRIINPGAFIAGFLLGIGFGLAVISAYACLRQVQFWLSLAGPAVMMAAYLSLIFYEPFFLAVLALIFILSIISVFLIWHSMPIFGRRDKAGDLRV